jgi:hypothetical protein
VFVGPASDGLSMIPFVLLAGVLLFVGMSQGSTPKRPT